MRLISLEVKNFGRIREARLEFGPRLNVFHGPNELGKSTLVDAIRAILLTPAAAAHGGRWRPWQKDASPEVELVFQSEQRRYWRAHKVFDSRGAAVLDESSDNVSYHNLAKQRGVDGELRKLLRWGLRPPGGRGGPKGMPETFLTAVLLPSQAEATKVFETSLEKDDGSARALLKEALEALTVDPILAQAIRQSQARVDEAFTATGRHKTGKNSPFQHASQRVQKRKRELEACQKTLDNSQHLRNREADLRSQVAEAQSQLDALRARLDRARRHEAATQQRDLVLGRKTKVDRQQEKVAQCEQNLRQTEDALARAAAEKAKCEADQSNALSQYESAQSQHTPEHRQLLRAEAQRKLADCRAEFTQAQQDEGLAVTRAKRADNAAAANRDLAQAKKTLDQLAAPWKSAEQELQLLDAQRRLAELNACQVSQAELQSQLEECQTAASRVAEIDKQSVELDTQRQSLVVPGDDELAALKQLWTRLTNTRVQLEVGLSITVAPARELQLEVTADDGTPEQVKLDQQEQRFSAGRRAVIDIADVGSLSVQAGNPQQQQQLADLEQRWQQQSSPWFARGQCDSLPQLEEQARLVDGWNQQLAKWSEERESAAHKAQQLNLIHDSLAKAGNRLTELRERWKAFAESVRTEAQRRHDSAPRDATELERALESAQDDARELGKSRQNADTAWRLAKEKTATCDGLLQQAKADAEAASVGSLESCEFARSACQRRLQELEATADALSSEEPVEVKSAAMALEAAKQALKAASDQVAQLQLQQTQQRGNRDEARGVLKTLQQSFDQGELDAADTKLAQLEAEIAAAKDAPAAADDLERQRDATTARVEDINKELLTTQTELGAKGGPSLVEQRDALAEAVAQYEREERLLIEDYEAWKLLNEALKDVESNEASNLGNALQPAMSQLLSDLSGGVHGGVDLGADLELLGIKSAGAGHAVRSLSIGMQDQFATLLRVHLAAELGHFVVLDDQLVQSDPQRMAWLREFLENRSRRCQICIFTCHPEDYPFPDCHFQDLTQVVSGIV